jgi:hypothetical protein
MPKGFADDYIQVNERIIAFKEEFPEGSLQSEVVTFTDSFVMVKAYAYRGPDDQRPGIGHSGLKIPGATSYTRGSELENAETSAWGRALAALGYEVKRGIASKEEVDMKSNGEVTVNIEGSEVAGVERGGRTEKANSVQVREVRTLSRALSLGAPGMRDLITSVIGDVLLLPEDETEAAATLVAYLEDLDREDIGNLITALKKRGEGADAASQV